MWPGSVDVAWSSTLMKTRVLLMGLRCKLLDLYFMREEMSKCQYRYWYLHKNHTLYRTNRRMGHFIYLCLCWLPLCSTSNELLVIFFYKNKDEYMSRVWNWYLIPAWIVQVGFGLVRSWDNTAVWHLSQHKSLSRH